MSGKVVSSSVKRVSNSIFSNPLAVLALLAVVIIVIVGAFFVKSRHIDSFESFPAPFVTENSVYSSLPPEKQKDNGYNYLTPFDESCLSFDANGKCNHNRKFNVMITPHNQRVEYWE